MGFALIENMDTKKYNINSYMADSPDDLKNLPDSAAPGSTCIVTNPTSVYMLNTKREWVLL